jgi:hypothetical protein
LSFQKSLPNFFAHLLLLRQSATRSCRTAHPPPTRLLSICDYCSCAALGLVCHTVWCVLRVRKLVKILLNRLPTTTYSNHPQLSSSYMEIRYVFLASSTPNFEAKIILVFGSIMFGWVALKFRRCAWLVPRWHRVLQWV